jgi:hypothetical protein
MVRAAVRLCLAVACVGAGWLIGAGARARAQERAPEPVISAISASQGVLYVVRDGTPFQCREGRVPGPTILSSSTGWVCEPVQLHFAP